MNGVGVGVNVMGVGDTVAKRSRVGMRVTVGCGVRVSAGGAGVGEMTSSRMGAKPEHPLRRKINKRIGRVFFMKIPLG